MSDVTVAKLQRLLASAILDAERTKPGSESERAAYARVADLQERIADATGPQSFEGEAARRGAVVATLRSGDREGARELVREYLGQDVTGEFADTLKRLYAEAAAPKSRPGRGAMFAALEAFSPGAPKDPRFVGARCPSCWRSDGGHNSRCPNRPLVT